MCLLREFLSKMSGSSLNYGLSIRWPLRGGGASIGVHHSTTNYSIGISWFVHTLYIRISVINLT